MSEQPETPKSGRTAEEIVHDIESDIRRTLGGWVGAKPDDDWDTIGRMMEANFRGRIAEFFGVEPGAEKSEVTWDDIGSKVNHDLRKAIGGWAGAKPDDDWKAVGEKVDEKIRASAGEAAGAKPAGAEGTASWEEIGKKIEANLRRGLGSWVNADPDADWDAIGNLYAERIRKAFGVKGEEAPAPEKKAQVPISGEESTGEGKPEA